LGVAFACFEKYYWFDKAGRRAKDFPMRDRLTDCGGGSDRLLGIGGEGVG
jgi:hypothetical protein